MSRKPLTEIRGITGLTLLAVVLACVLYPADAASQLSLRASPEPGREIVLGIRGAVERALHGLDPTGPDIAHWKLREEEGRLWPTLLLQGRSSAENELVSGQPGITSLLPGTDFLRYSAGLQMDYNLLQFLESRVRIQGTKAEERASTLHLTQQQSESALKVSGAYLTLLFERESLSHLDQLRRKQVDFLREQEAKFAEDTIPMIAVVRARSQIISVDRESLAARRRAASAELELRKLTGIKPEERIILAFDPREVDLSFITARGLKGLLGLAKEANPRLLAANAATESAQWQALAARSANYPKLNLSMFYGYGHDQIFNPDSSSTGSRYSAFLTLNIPLFDGGVRRAQIAQSDLRVESQQREEIRTAEEIKTQIEDAYWSFLEKEQARDLLEQQLRLADDELKQATARAEAGVDPAEEPLSAVSRLVRLKQDLARTRIEALTMGIGLAVAVGHNPFIALPGSPASSRQVQAVVASIAASTGSEVTPRTLSLDDLATGGHKGTATDWPIVSPPQPESSGIDSSGPLEVFTKPGTDLSHPSLSAQPPDPRVRKLGEGPQAPTQAAGPRPQDPGPDAQIVQPVTVLSPPPTSLTQLQPARVLAGIRVAQVEHSTLVTLLSDGTLAKHVAFELQDPPRFVIDFPGVLETKANLERTVSVNTPQLKRIRVARHLDKLRIVFDLPQRGAVAPQVTQGDDGLLVTLVQGQ